MDTEDGTLVERIKKPRNSGPGENIVNILENTPEGGIIRLEMNRISDKSGTLYLRFLLDHNLVTAANVRAYLKGERYIPTATYHSFDKQLLIYAIELMYAESQNSVKRNKSRNLKKINILSELAKSESDKLLAVAEKNIISFQLAKEIFGGLVDNEYALKTGPDKNPSYSITQKGRDLLEGVHNIVQQLREERGRLVTMLPGQPVPMYYGP